MSLICIVSEGADCALMDSEPVMKAFFDSAGEEILTTTFAGVVPLNSNNLQICPEHDFLRRYIQSQSEGGQANLQQLLLFATGSSSEYANCERRC